MKRSLRSALVVVLTAFAIVVTTGSDDALASRPDGCAGECKKHRHACDKDCLKSENACIASCGSCEPKKCTPAQRKCLGACSARGRGCFRECSKKEHTCRAKC